ncbi:MAG: electron transport complex subunit RsxE [Fusobacteriia bacterium 4572_132]|nr:MAG: electron transport complex subunit RsxE [Fusobacteriia bacterium 4572_132]
MSEKKYYKTFIKGIFKENPVFVLLLGLCPTLGVTSSAINGLAMGLATLAVLVSSNILISLIRKIIPDKIRIPAYIMVIATLVTAVDMGMNAYLPTLYKLLGLFIPLIVVNCIILGRAESFASKNNAILSALDGLGIGLGFTLSLTVLGGIREILGNGSLFNISLFGDAFQPAIIFILPPGAFITMGFIMAGLNQLKKFKKK